ncbi:GNAT family N-acetyltransferase [Paenibacillus yanchengensis]|uniref:GNAT family N-acetyltransferase n=1 Tax=Paenibacillus yanchengensis TaxID=2035833 RepID=A0ABW4YG01_9BACL
MVELMQMQIRLMERSDVPQVVVLWNEEAMEYHYQPFSVESFIAKFFEHDYYIAELLLVGVIDSEIVAFAAGCIGEDLPLGNVAGYITTVIGRRDRMQLHHYDALVQQLEQCFRERGKKQADILFFNPMKLAWNMPTVPSHEHNNAPGIDRAMPFYSTLKKRHYVERAMQCGMYLALGNFVIPEDILQKEQQAYAKGYAITMYKQAQHTGLEAMLQALNNEQWLNDVTRHAREAVPLVVAIQNDRCVGFAGPIVRESNGRAFFSGIGVHPDHEGHGLGSILFFKMIEAFQQASCQYVTLFTGSNNPAIRIYTKAGFRVEKQFAILRKELS